MKGLKHEELARETKSHLSLFDSKSSMNSVDMPNFSSCKKREHREGNNSNNTATNVTTMISK